MGKTCFLPARVRVTHVNSIQGWQGLRLASQHAVCSGSEWEHRLLQARPWQPSICAYFFLFYVGGRRLAGWLSRQPLRPGIQIPFLDL